MIDFTIPEEIEKLKEKTQKFILENVIVKIIDSPSYILFLSTST